MQWLIQTFLFLRCCQVIQMPQLYRWWTGSLRGLLFHCSVRKREIIPSGLSPCKPVGDRGYDPFRRPCCAEIHSPDHSHNDSFCRRCPAARCFLYYNRYEKGSFPAAAPGKIRQAQILLIFFQSGNNKEKHLSFLTGAFLRTDLLMPSMPALRRMRLPCLTGLNRDFCPDHFLLPMKIRSARGAFHRK